jgi:hypothetical protein
MRKIGFEAKILEIKTKSLVCGTKATRIILEFDSDKMNEVLNNLNELQQPKKNVMVVIMELEKDSIDEEIGNLS